MINPIFLTTGNNQNHPGWLQLKRSLDRFGWSYHFIEHSWNGLADRIGKLADYIRSNQVNYFVFGDAYDVFVNGTPNDFMQRNSLFIDRPVMLYMAEKGCYPVSAYQDHYPAPLSGSPWRYVNGGCFAGYGRAFLNLVDSFPIPFDMNDQQWATENFLFRNFNKIFLDYDCHVFQSIAFEHDKDFAYNSKGQLINLVTVTNPIIIHGNGQTPMDIIYALLP